ncbi:hypothetical protein CHS0354_021860 [Potamilus streckersoni]|uniref:Uncharacterized protein n=1 Tax=Potamilus streckersoni TaxID=2493646 RepID=A0AAE0SER0_9BIVA|nr:hypothetical protein CHS0354_021860 [Potamilus streckersoni]
MDLEKNINEQKVLENELKNLRKGASVYKKQQNSNVFFKANREKVFHEAKKNLEDLITEYKQLEATSEGIQGETTPLELSNPVEQDV